jgi:hypothetical protein
MENKKLYDGVVEPFEDYHRIVSKEHKGVVFAYKFNHKDRTIKYYITDEFKENKEAMRVFKIFKITKFKLIQLNKEEKEIK